MKYGTSYSKVQSIWGPAHKNSFYGKAWKFPPTVHNAGGLATLRVAPTIQKHGQKDHKGHSHGGHWHVNHAGKFEKSKIAVSKKVKEPALLECTTVKEWAEPKCNNYLGMVIRRTPTWEDVQPYSDHIFKQMSDLFHKQNDCLKEKVPMAGDKLSDAKLSASFKDAAQRLIAPLLEHGLPEQFGELIVKDCEEVGMVVGKITKAQEVVLKIEIVADNSCMRWHQDKYTARAICTYNCSGTEYIHHNHVDFYELENCGNNDCVVPDRSKVQAVDVGDFLLIKGSKYPGEVNGLVHKSPVCQFYPDEEVMTRFCLKIDVY